MMEKTEVCPTCGMRFFQEGYHEATYDYSYRASRVYMWGVLKVVFEEDYVERTYENSRK